MNTPRIEPLTKDNYDSWRKQMRSLLEKCDAFGYANGEILKPTSDGSDEAFGRVGAWAKSDSIAKAQIIKAISPFELRYVRPCDTAMEVWTTLEIVHQSTPTAKKTTLLKKSALRLFRCCRRAEKCRSAAT